MPDIIPPDYRKLHEAILDNIDALMSIVGGGVSVLDREMRIVYYARSFEKLIGPLEKNKGCKCYEVYCKKGEACAGCPLPDVFAEPDGPIRSIEGAV